MPAAALRAAAADAVDAAAVEKLTPCGKASADIVFEKLIGAGGKCADNTEAGRCSGSQEPEPESPQESPREPESEPEGAGARPRQKTVTIFDWDDTLFPTTWLREQGLLGEQAAVTPAHDARLEALARLVAATLEAAKTRGGVAIVTNAEQGWVEMSCEEAMPSLQPHLAGVRVISASSRHKRRCPSAPTAWKCLAFAELVAEFYGSSGQSDATPRRNIISVGDSEHEMKALKRVATTTACLAKCLKFCPRPSLEQLAGQHRELARFADDVVDHEGDLDCEVGGADGRGSAPRPERPQHSPA
mmetsp:Transcript_29651/g.84714  ORF Transcript_29651/g.84714 Transcript_29651/m.84714 type:complete len:302 (-) Transcript_29651:59-964(-)